MNKKAKHYWTGTGTSCIYTSRLFSVVDIFVIIVVSALPWYSFLQMLFFRPMYLQLALLWTCRCFSVCLAWLNCIYILLFLGFKDTSFANFASTSHVFDNVRMLLIKILHLQSPKIHYRRYLFPYPLSCYLLHKLNRYITYKKIDIRNSSEYGVSVGDT